MFFLQSTRKQFFTYSSLVPLKSHGAALISLTGDTTFNRDLRIRAIKQGMHLNEFGLWKWKANDPDSTPPDQLISPDPPPSPVPPKKVKKARSGSETINGGGFWELVRASTEEDILAELGMSYIPPEKRNFGNLLDKRDLARASRGR